MILLYYICRSVLYRSLHCSLRALRLFTKYRHSPLNALILYHDFKSSKAARSSIYVVTCEGTVDHFHVSIIVEIALCIVYSFHDCMTETIAIRSLK
jgi:hypothetical protein